MRPRGIVGFARVRGIRVFGFKLVVEEPGLQFLGDFHCVLCRFWFIQSSEKGE